MNVNNMSPHVVVVVVPTPGQSGPGSNDNEGVHHTFLTFRTRASAQDVA